MAGIGGMMAVIEKLARHKAKRKTGTTTTTNKPAAKRKNAPAKKRESKAAKQSKGKRVDGLEMLRQAADRHLGRDAEALAGSMTARAHDGKLDNTRMLVSLAEKK